MVGDPASGLTLRQVNALTKSLAPIRVDGSPGQIFCLVKVFNDVPRTIASYAGWQWRVWGKLGAKWQCLKLADNSSWQESAR